MRHVLAATVLALSASFALADFDLILRGGTVVDGTGKAGYVADVAIQGQRIAAIGDLSDEKAARELDAKGLIVSPGFIDVHTHVDDDIFDHPLAENFVRDGVTTIVSGNCGGSVSDVGAFFARFDKTPAAVNHATLYGHNTVLRDVKGSIATPLSPPQLEEAKRRVDKAMDDGAVGFSTGLIYTPGTWSDTDEIIALTKVAAEKGGLYATHMRSEGGDILNAIDEALRIGREAGCRVQISHFKLPTNAAVRLGRGSMVKAGSDITLAKVEAARAAGQDVWLDQYPYTASSTTISTLIPDWVLEQGADEARKILADPAQRQKVLDEMRHSHEATNKRVDMSYVVIASASDRPELSGKNIKQITQLRKFKAEHGASPELLGDATTQPGAGDPWASMQVSMREQYETILDIYEKGGASCVFHSMDEIEVGNILRSPLVSVASDSGMRVYNVGVPHPRGYGTNARVLGRYVRELKLISIEEAVRKMTSMPAGNFGMTGRGTLAVGAYADINVFDAATVSDQATFEKPHQYSTGFHWTFVNGTMVFDGKQMTGRKPGMAIYGPGRR
jgi:N-acyl-D-amino-acid deacylase